MKEKVILLSTNEAIELCGYREEFEKTTGIDFYKLTGIVATECDRYINLNYTKNDILANINEIYYRIKWQLQINSSDHPGYVMDAIKKIINNLV